MFAKSIRRDRDASTEVEYTEPLLGSQHNSPIDRTLFAVEDSDDEAEGTALNTAKPDTHDHVRFQEDVQVIGPPLRSTLASREAGEYVPSFSFPELVVWEVLTFLICYQSMSWTQMKLTTLSFQEM
ncbi:hypothetical protein BDZ94DRAFT_877757 [Collybia nuda]|uniref:Uncharacterized protein n=1 Tax=Collybia nuda TaxID=64659 RepID=A0A9P5Y3M3_9AGAR|nr:hypothetical protein BDZ94DRAFT_877757 [Collybia nuda]